MLPTYISQAVLQTFIKIIQITDIKKKSIYMVLFIICNFVNNCKKHQDTVRQKFWSKYVMVLKKNNCPS